MNRSKKSFSNNKRSNSSRHDSFNSAGGGGGKSSMQQQSIVINRHPVGTGLIDEQEYKEDVDLIYKDDSKFSRLLKRLFRDDDDDERLNKIKELSKYLDGQENIKFVLKLGIPALNVLLKTIWDQ